ncbi:MAG TPA: phosphatase PAP2 family protein [Thermomicrobiales bacterium]
MRQEATPGYRVPLVTRPSWLIAREAVLCIAGYVVYSLLRGVVAGDRETASSHARQIIHLERALGLFREAALQQWALGVPGMAHFWNGIYLWMHTPLVIFTLIYLYLRHRPTYVVIRNVFFISAAIGLLCYALYPTAPPRLMPGYGFTDTIANMARAAPDVRPGAFENAYAAVPSLHVGWAVMIALAFWWTARHWVVRVLAVVEAVGMLAAVVFTANHYFFDAAAGIAVVLVSLGIVRTAQTWTMKTPMR